MPEQSQMQQPTTYEQIHQPGRVAAAANLFSENVLPYARRAFAIGAAAISLAPAINPESASASPIDIDGTELHCTTNPAPMPCAWDMLKDARQQAIASHPDMIFVDPSDERLHDWVTAVGGIAGTSQEDPIETISLVRSGTKNYKINLRQINEVVNVAVGEFQKATTSDKYTYTNASIDADLFQNKKVTLTPMINKSGKLHKKGKTITEKNWDTRDPSKLFTIADSSSSSPTHHRSKMTMKLPFSKSQIKKGNAYLVLREYCKPRDPSYDPRKDFNCKDIPGYGFRLKPHKRTSYRMINSSYRPGDIIRVRKNNRFYS